jgi:hypothetical protein
VIRYDEVGTSGYEAGLGRAPRVDEARPRPCGVREKVAGGCSPLHTVRTRANRRPLHWHHGGDPKSQSGPLAVHRCRPLNNAVLKSGVSIVLVA